MFVPLGRRWAWMIYGVVATAAALWADRTQAAAITDTAPVFAPGESFAESGTDIFIPRFDPALGTLTMVSAQLTGTLTPGQSNLQTLTPPLTSPVLYSPSVEIAFPPGGTQLLPTQSVPITTVGGIEQAIGAPEAVDLTATYPPTLPQEHPPIDFTGAGTIDFYIRGSSGAPRGGIDVLDVATLAGQLAVTYTYTPATAAVPEPVSVAVLGTGLVGLALARRRKPG